MELRKAVIDLDDVLIPTHEQCLIPLARTMGGEPLVTLVQRYANAGFPRRCGYPDYDAVEEVYRSLNTVGRLFEQPFPRRSRRLLELLPKFGYLPVLVTARRPEVAQETVSWLTEHGIHNLVEDIHVIGNHWVGGETETKGDYCHRLNAAFFLDDMPRYALDVAQKSPETRVFLYGAYPWNTGEHTPGCAHTRVESLAQVIRELRS